MDALEGTWVACTDGKLVRVVGIAVVSTPPVLAASRTFRPVPYWMTLRVGFHEDVVLMGVASDIMWCDATSAAPRMVYRTSTFYLSAAAGNAPRDSTAETSNTEQTQAERRDSFWLVGMKAAEGPLGLRRWWSAGVRRIWSPAVLSLSSPCQSLSSW